MKTVHVFLSVDMRQGHDGLLNYAESRGVKLKELSEETACIFISKNKLRMKAYSYNGVVSYLRAVDTNRPFDLNAIDEFPKAFSKDGVMDYSKALKARLEKTFSTKGPLKEAKL